MRVCSCACVRLDSGLAQQDAQIRDMALQLDRLTVHLLGPPNPSREDERSRGATAFTSASVDADANSTRTAVALPVFSFVTDHVLSDANGRARPGQTPQAPARLYIPHAVPTPHRVRAPDTASAFEAVPSVPADPPVRVGLASRTPSPSARSASRSEFHAALPQSLGIASPASPPTHSQAAEMDAPRAPPRPARIASASWDPGR